VFPTIPGRIVQKLYLKATDTGVSPSELIKGLDADGTNGSVKIEVKTKENGAAHDDLASVSPRVMIMLAYGVVFAALFTLLRLTPSGERSCVVCGGGVGANDQGGGQG
jgi:hypothetical protein